MVSEGQSGGIERPCIHLLHGYTNLKLFIKEFLLKKNWGLTKQIMHNKKTQRKARENLVMKGTPFPMLQTAVGRNNIEGW